MDVRSKAASPTPQTEFAKSPLVLLRDTEALLRRKTVATIVPILPRSVGKSLQQVSAVAEASLQQIARIDLEQISDRELANARIFIGLTFVGFGALFVSLLLLYLYTLHPDLSSIEQIHKYWHYYIWFVSLGVTGMFFLGREAMRP